MYKALYNQTVIYTLIWILTTLHGIVYCVAAIKPRADPGNSKQSLCTLKSINCSLSFKFEVKSLLNSLTYVILKR